MLIIWDRLFGTFQEEEPKGEIIYGLVVNPESFNPLYLQVKAYGDIIFDIWLSFDKFAYAHNPHFFHFFRQVFYIKQLIEKSIHMDTWANKLAVFWKGPSWFPGGPRLGLDEYKIHVSD